MSDPPEKERRRRKRLPSVYALIADAERAGKHVTSLTVTLGFEELGGAPEASGSESLTPLEEWRKSKGRGQS